VAAAEVQGGLADLRDSGIEGRRPPMLVGTQSLPAPLTESLEEMPHGPDSQASGRGEARGVLALQPSLPEELTHLVRDGLWHGIRPVWGWMPTGVSLCQRVGRRDRPEPAKSGMQNTIRTITGDT
jgi:hypothetical protein